MAQSIVYNIIARDKASKTFGSVGGAVKTFGGLLAGLGIASFAKSAVNLEAQFGQTMAMIAASTGAPAKAMAKLDEMAIQLGADTSFSAGEAADAMLELGKAGISTRDIMRGGVAGTLTLAAAGGTDLATAATIGANAMNAFGLKGKDMAKIAAALAGGANASSASVESLGLGLSQVSAGARNAGLSLNETVGALSAFDAAGVKGSDAGTSLKTFLARLVPTTEKAKDAMDALGLSFVKPNGEFKSLGAISDELGKEMGHLSAAERQKAMSTIFGSDATRAATILMREGSKGLGKYKKATEDQGAAEKMAAARMSGTAGTIERLKGSFETAALVVGKSLSPAVQKAGDWLATKLVPAAEDTTAAFKTGAQFVKEHKTALMILGGVILTLTAVTKAHATVMKVQAAGGLLKYMAATKLVTAVTKTWAAVQWVLNAAMSANPVGIAIALVVALGVAAYVAYKKSDTFRAGVQAAFKGVASAGKFMWNNVLQPVLKGMVSGFASVMGFFGRMLQTLGQAPGMGWVGDLGDKLVGASEKADTLAMAIKDIPNKKTVQVSFAVSGTANSIAPGLQRVVKGFASGTHSASPGWAWVGEEGPELMRMRGGEQVVPARESRRMTEGGGMSGAQFERFMRRLEKMEIRVTGVPEGQRAYLLTGGMG